MYDILLRVYALIEKINGFPHNLKKGMWGLPDVRNRIMTMIEFLDKIRFLHIKFLTKFTCGLLKVYRAIFLGDMCISDARNPHWSNFKVYRQICNFLNYRRVHSRKNIIRIFIFVFPISENYFIPNFRIKEQILNFRQNDV